MRTNGFAAGAALVAAGLLAGCGGGGDGGGVSHTALSASAKTPQGLTATLTEDKAAVAIGGSVTYTLTLANHMSLPISYQTITGCAIEAGHVGGALFVTDAAGKRAFPGGGGCALVGISPTATLAPGQSVSDTFTPPGGYFGDNPFTAAGPYHATASFDVLAPDENSNLAAPTQVGPLTVDVQ